MDNVFKYFPNLTTQQQAQFAALPDLYATWNAQINVISRKDIEHLIERHILHSLAIAKVISFANGTRIMDVGTGGGFPGIPLAIMFPEVDFVLVDSVGKKIKVVNEIAIALGLQNVKGIHARAEQIDDQFDFIVSRAVAALPEFMGWVAGKIKKKGINELENGVLYLKGGDLDAELIPLKQYWKVYNLKDIFEEPFFETKKVVHISRIL